MAESKSMKSNSLIEALLNKNWEEADFQSRKGRVYVSRTVKVENFFDGKIASEVYPLHVACQKNAPIHIIRTLYETFPDAALAPDSKYKRLPVHLAVMEGASPKTVLALLKLTPQSARFPDRLGRLPLHYSCKAEKNSEINTRYLLKAYGKAALKPDVQGYLPLHVACRCGASLEVIRMLTRVAPTAIYAKTAKGSSAATCAKQGGNNPDVIAILERCEKDASSLEADETFDLGSIGGTSVSSFESLPTWDESSVRSKPLSIASDLFSEYSR